MINEMHLKHSNAFCTRSLVVALVNILLINNTGSVDCTNLNIREQESRSDGLKDIFAPWWNTSVEASNSLEVLAAATIKMLDNPVGTLVYKEDEYEDPIPDILSAVFLKRIKRMKLKEEKYPYPYNEEEVNYIYKPFDSGPLIEYLEREIEMIEFDPNIKKVERTTPNQVEAIESDLESNITEEQKVTTDDLIDKPAAKKESNKRKPDFGKAVDIDGYITVPFLCYMIRLMDSEKLYRFFQLCYKYSRNCRFSYILLNFLREEEKRLILNGKESSGFNYKRRTTAVESLQLIALEKVYPEYLTASLKVLNSYITSEIEFERNIKNLRVEVKQNDSIRVSLDYCKPGDISSLLVALETRTGPDFPIYELCLESIDFREEEDLSALSSIATKNIKSVIFNNCIFKDSVFRLTMEDILIFSEIEELKIIACTIEEIDSKLSELNSLVILDICGCSFTEIPDFIFGMTNLIKLGIQDGLLGSISEKINKLVNLIAINFSHNPLFNFPTSILEIEGKGIRELVLKNIRINSIPVGINRLNELEILILDENDLSNICDTCRLKLKKLTYLSMSKCNLTRFLPYSLVEMDSSYFANITTLNISCNEFLSLPHAIIFMPTLSVLMVNDNKVQLSNINYVFGSPNFDPTKLKRLILSNTRLSVFPRSIERLINLEKLSMASCGISVIPPSISLLKNLIIVDFSCNNELVSLPREISELSNLEYLDISRTSTRAVRYDIAFDELKSLKTLRLNGCYLADELYDKIYDQKNLRCLYISYFDNLSSRFKLELIVNLKKLQELYISISMNIPAITEIANHYLNTFELSKLRILKIYPTDSAIINGIGKLVNLEELEISNYVFNYFPIGLFELMLLKTLKLHGCSLFCEIPSEINSLMNLRELYIQKCYASDGNNRQPFIRNIPKSILNLISLNILNLSENNILEIPDISSLSNLIILKLQKNNITKIAVDFFKFTHLRTLDLDNNELIMWKIQTLAELPSLRLLTIQNNRLKEIKSIKNYRNSSNIVNLKLPNIRALNFKGNMLKKIPMDLISGLSRVTKLNFSHNEIKEISRMKNVVLPTLKNLNLEKNRFKKIPKWVLFNLPGLKKLSVKNNKIRKISNHSRLYILEELNISKNKLTSFPTKFISELHKFRIRMLNIYSNPITITQEHRNNYPMMRIIDTL